MAVGLLEVTDFEELDERGFLLGQDDDIEVRREPGVECRDCVPADENVFELALIEFFEEFDQRGTAIVEAHERIRSDSR